MSKPLNPLSVSELKSLNEQVWADFRAHWPMEVLRLLSDVGGGFLFGVCLGLAGMVAGLERLV